MDFVSFWELKYGSAQTAGYLIFITIVYVALFSFMSEAFKEIIHEITGNEFYENKLDSSLGILSFR